jgi:hypothetical protein
MRRVNEPAPQPISRTWEPDHDAQAVALGDVEQPARGHAVSADRVQPVSGDLGKVVLNDVATVLGAVPVGAKGPVGHAANPELLLTEPKELAAGSRSFEAWCRR